jgi:hypothetical protein
MSTPFGEQLVQLSKLVDDLGVESVRDADVEQARLELSRIKDSLRAKMLILSERYTRIAAERAAHQKLATMTDAEKAALAQSIQATGIVASAKTGGTGS